MARPRKEGITYFPMDCSFFEDDKIEYTFSVAGAEAVLGFQRLLCAIYQKGLCWRFGEVEKVAYAARSGSKTATVNKWLACWLTCGLFDPDVYAATGYLTSKAIQRRYLEIVKGRVELKIPSGVLLLPEKELPAGLTISYIDLKDKVKGNYEFPTISTEFLAEKPTETPNTKESLDKKSPGYRDGAQKIGDHVYLKAQEYNKMKAEFGKDHVRAKITSLDANIENGNKKYMAFKNHYKTILGWLRNDVSQGKICVVRHSKPSGPPSPVVREIAADLAKNIKGIS
jgi:hypothetical protein